MRHTHTHSPNEPCFFALQFYIGSKLQLYWGVSGFDPAGFDSCSVVWFSASSDLAGQPRWHTVALRTLGGQNLDWSSNPQIRVNFGRVIRDYPPLYPRNPGAPGFFPESLVPLFRMAWCEHGAWVSEAIPWQHGSPPVPRICWTFCTASLSASCQMLC